MTDLLQTGSFSATTTAAAPKQAVINPPAWEFLWLQADVGNQSALNVWLSDPPGNRAPDFTLGPGQQREQDMGAVAAYSWWITSADGSPWALKYALDVQPIGIDANVVGATTPLEPAANLGQYTTQTGVSLYGPFPIRSAMQGVMLRHFGSSPPSVFGVQTGMNFPCFAASSGIPELAGAGAWVYFVPSGTLDIQFKVEDLNPMGLTVQVDGIFTPIMQSVIAAQGAGQLGDGSWLVTIRAGATVAATQSGAWNVGQSGAWNVGQSGVWTVGATQSGAWAVAATQSGAWTVAATQSGAWTVGQSGAPWTTIAGAVATANILGGSVNTLNGGPSTLITIPANRTWKGTVGCTATAGVVAAIKTGNGTGSSTPSAGTLLAQTNTGAPAVASDIYVAAQTGTATITLSTSGANGDGWANGVLL